MNFKRSAGALTGALMLAMTSVGAFAQDIKIGFNGDISASPSALSGQGAVLGMQAAMDDINAAGGVLGRKLVLVVRDDLAQPPKSIQNMSDLIDNEKVVAVVGPTNSGNALAWKQIPNQKKVVSMGTVATGSGITTPMSPGAENYMFRVSINDRLQVSSLLAYAKKNPSTKVVGFLTETTGYGQGGLRDMEELAKLYGITPACNEKFAVGDTDMTSQLQKCKAAGVDTIVVWGQGTPMGLLMRSMDKMNYFPKALTSWGADNQSFFEAAGKTLAERPIFVRTITDDLSPRQKQLHDRLASKLPSPSAFAFAAQSYDGVMLLAQAIKQANSTEGPKIRAALEDLKTPYDGVMKKFDHPFSTTNREALGPADYRWVHWKDGKLTRYSDDITKALTPADFKR